MGKHRRLKALSIRQPFAELIMLGKKRVEYRRYRTKIRGRIYIYASKQRWDRDLELTYARETGLDLETLPRGVLVGTVELVDCREIATAGLGSDHGDFEWILANPERLSVLLPPCEKPQPMWFHPFGRPDS